MTLTYAKVTDLNRLETTATLINGSTVRRISGLLMTISDGYLRHSSAPSAGAKHDGCIGYEKKLLSFLGPSVGFSLPAASCVRASLGTSQATNFRGKNSERTPVDLQSSVVSFALLMQVRCNRTGGNSPTAAAPGEQPSRSRVASQLAFTARPTISRSRLCHGLSA